MGWFEESSNINDQIFKIIHNLRKLEKEFECFKKQVNTTKVENTCGCNDTDYIVSSLNYLEETLDCSLSELNLMVNLSSDKATLSNAVVKQLKVLYSISSDIYKLKRNLSGKV